MQLSSLPQPIIRQVQPLMRQVQPLVRQVQPLVDHVRGLKVLQRDGGAVQALPKALLRQAFDFLRSHQPLLVLPRFAVATRHDDVVEVLSRPEDFGVADVYAERMRRTTGLFILGMEQSPEYERESRWLRAAVHLGDTEHVRALTRGYIDETLEAARRNASEGVVQLDLVTTLSRRIPVRLINDYFGIPVADEAQMMHWMRATFWELFFNLTNGGRVRRAAKRAAEELNAYLERIIAARVVELEHGEERHDFLSRLLRTRADFGEPAFDDVDVRRNIAGVIIGAVDTLNKSIAQLVVELLGRPQELSGAVLAAQNEDIELVSRYAYEALRFDPLNPILLRTCRRDCVVARDTPRQATIAAGSSVVVATQSAMFDPEVFLTPEQFRVDRPYQPYLLFGEGQHRCFGEAFVRVIIPEVLAALLRLPRLRRASDPMRFEGPFPDRLLLEFDAASN